MADNVKEHVIQHEKTAVSRADRVTPEEGAKQCLASPFIQLLGYDPLGLNEIIREARAPFSGKFRNEVYRAIGINRVPVVAVPFLESFQRRVEDLK